MNFQNKVVLITGATSGIGEALAVEFAKQGAHLILAGRRKERLDELSRRLSDPHRKVLALSLDVRRSEDFKHAVELAEKMVSTLDVVVANAGFGVVGSAFELDLEDYQNQFETNVNGVLRTFFATREALKKSRGVFAVVGSVNGYVALPGNSPYAMSKFAVRALCRSLRHEAKDYGIAVTHIAPGFVKSEIRKVTNEGILHPSAKDPIPDWLQMRSETAARKICYAIYQRRKERILTLHGFIAVYLERIFPWVWDILIGVLGVRARRQPQSH